MAFHLHSNEDDVLMEINTTPLIDVMLVLLVMLIITIPPQLHAINMNMPVTIPAVEKTPTVVNIDIDEQGNYFWNGKEIAREYMKERLKILKSNGDIQPEFHIKPSKKTHYRYLTAVMSEVSTLGFTKIGIVGNERFVQD
jgi:biopolymer transport protein ExbD